MLSLAWTIAREGVAFTDYYAQQSCTAGRAAFISGSVPVRSGMTKVGMPGAKEGWQIAELRETICREIDWGALPKVSSTVLFQQIKEFLLFGRGTRQTYCAVREQPWRR